MKDYSNTEIPWKLISIFFIIVLVITGIYLLITKTSTETKFGILGGVIILVTALLLARPAILAFLNKSIISIIVLIVISFIVIAIGINFPDIMKSHWNDINPEKSVELYFESFNEGNFEEALNMTVYNFANESVRQHYAISLETYYLVFQGGYIWVNNITYTQNMTEEVKKAYKSQINNLEIQYNITVVDYCVINYSLHDSSYHGYTGSALYIKIDYSWYLASHWLEG